MNTPPPLKTKEMDPSSRCPNTRSKDVVIYTGLSNMKVNLSNPKKWPKCHWSFQEKCYLPRFHPSPFHHPGCYNYAHSRCVLEWCRRHSIPFDDPKSVGLFCREHFPEYSGLLYPMETYNPAVGVKGAKPKVFNSRGEETYEPCMGDMTSNGLWFAPECFNCREDILRFAVGLSSAVARPPLQDLGVVVNAVPPRGPASSLSLDRMVVAAVPRPKLPSAPAVAGLLPALAFAVARRGGFTRSFLPSRFDETRGYRR
jgi:hypothetical protein